MRTMVAIMMLVCAGPAIAQDLKMPEKVQLKPGEKYMLKAETAGEVVRFEMVKPCAGLVVFYDGVDFPLPGLKATKSCVLVACKPGVYEIRAWTAIKNEPSAIYICVVTVSDGPTPPPDPPKPPDPKPPDPKPPTPPPLSPLAVKLQACFAADPGAPAAKAAQRVALIGLYQAMTDHAKNENIKTTGDLLADLKAVAGQMIAPGSLIECRKLIAAEIALALGDNPGTVLDAAMRLRAVEVFDRIAKSLQEFK